MLRYNYFLFISFFLNQLKLSHWTLGRSTVIELMIFSYFCSLHFLFLHLHKCKTPFWFTTRLLLSSRFMPVVKSTTSSWSSWSFSSDVFVLLVCCEPEDSWLLRLNEPRRGVANVRWFAGFTVMMRFELFATIMSVTCGAKMMGERWRDFHKKSMIHAINPFDYMFTWSSVFPCTSMPFTSSTSSFTASKPVDSARPPGTRRDMKMPGCFSMPFGVTFTDVPSRM